MLVKKRHDRLPSLTELNTFLPQLGGGAIGKLLEEGEIAILPEYKFREINVQKIKETKADTEYLNKMREFWKQRAIDEKRLAVSERGPFKDNPEVFYPKTITHDGKTYDSKKFFMDNVWFKLPKLSWKYLFTKY